MRAINNLNKEITTFLSHMIINLKCLDKIIEIKKGSLIIKKLINEF